MIAMLKRGKRPAVAVRKGTKAFMPSAPRRHPAWVKLDDGQRAKVTSAALRFRNYVLLQKGSAA